jgi:hypothetical protein
VEETGLRVDIIEVSRVPRRVDASAAPSRAVRS